MNVSDMTQTLASMVRNDDNHDLRAIIIVIDSDTGEMDLATQLDALNTSGMLAFLAKKLAQTNQVSMLEVLRRAIEINRDLNTVTKYDHDYDR